MATTIKTGLIDTEDILGDERVVDMSERFYKLQPDEQQFRVALATLGQKEAIREKVNWLEDEYMPRVSALAASAESSDTTLTVTTGEGNTVFRPGHVIRCMETGEGMLVTATSANSVGVTRTWGGTAAVSATSVAKLMIIGNASAQGASSGEAAVVQRVLGFNYIQEQRDPMWFTTVQTAIELYGGREPAKEVAKKAVEHGRAIENSFFFGARDFNSSASPGPMGSSGGAIEYISTNITTSNDGNLSPAEFDLFLEGPYGYGSKNKALFCAPRVGTVLSQMLRAAWAPASVDDRKYGAKVSAWVNGTYGDSLPVYVKREWADLAKTSTNYGTWAFLIDMDYVRMRYLRGLNTHLRRNIQEPSSTAEAHEYYTAFALEFAWEKAHGIYKGITTYSAT